MPFSIMTFIKMPFGTMTISMKRLCATLRITLNHHVECRYAERLILFIVILNVVILNAVILNVVILNVVILNVVMLNFVNLRDVAPVRICWADCFGMPLNFFN
jgi:hypothetical protein